MEKNTEITFDEKGKVDDVGYCSLDLIEKLTSCVVTQNHTGLWGVLLNKKDGVYAFMDKDKNKVYEWIRDCEELKP